MKFTKPWVVPPSADGADTKVPVLDVYLQTVDGRALREVLVVDSGADLSMGPRRLCNQLGLAWEAGAFVEVQGISPLEECKVAASIHQVDIYIREAACRITIPFCFAEGDAPLLLGREGFFDAFRIQFDKQHYLTTFER